MTFDWFRAMNTDVLLATDSKNPVDEFDRARSFIKSGELRFSRFLPESELNWLNAHSGERVQVSDDMFNLLELALRYHIETEGLFDPSILPDLERMGYDRSMDEIQAGGDITPLSGKRKESGSEFSERDLDNMDLKIRLPIGIRIDLGGIAKGWIVEQAAREMRIDSQARAVNAGGDMFFSGKPEGNDGWEVGVEDPRNPRENLTVLRVDECAVATSSIGKRKWQQERMQRHHLIDPRSGEPAESPWVSVTVLAPAATQAEVYAKTILIGGQEAALKLIKQQPQIDFLAVDHENQIWRNEHGVIKCQTLVN